MTEGQTVDIAVVGAALVGSTLASVFARLGFTVALFEQRDLHATPAQDGASSRLSSRTTALSLSSIRILQSLGLWESLSEDAVDIKQVHVTQAGNFGVVRMDAKEQRLACLGAVINNSSYQHIVLRDLLAHPNVMVCSPAIVTDMDTSQPETVRLHYSMGNACHELSTRLVIGVDGVSSSIRTLSGIPVKTTDYEQSVVLVNVESELDNRGVAFERFTHSGPLAFLPLGRNLNSVICTIERADESRVAAFDDKELLEFLQSRFGYRLGRLQSCGARQILPIQLTESGEQVKGRVLLMGNAARSLHPVAGQGFNLALRDAAGLIEALGNSSQQAGNCDPGSADILASLTSSRRADQAATVRMTDTLARLFRGNNAVISHLRGLGLLSLEYVSPLRRVFARQAMGTTAWQATSVADSFIDRHVDLTKTQTPDVSDSAQR